MKPVNNISIIFIFLFSFLVQAQDEKSFSFFSDQQQFGIEQLQVNTSNSSDCTSQNKISTISLKQVGDGNVANIYNSCVGGNQIIYQIGDKNNYQFFNNTNSELINLGVLQKGNDNFLKITGANSLFQNFAISQFGGAKMSVINY